MQINKFTKIRVKIYKVELGNAVTKEYMMENKKILEDCMRNFDK